MDEPIKPIEQVLAEWLSIAVERFQESIKKNKIGVTQKLFESFLTNMIQGSGGKISKLEIDFLFYGRYIDMGVGKGFPIGGRRTFKDYDKYRYRNGQLLRSPGRKPKKWYSKTKSFEVSKLTKILAEQYGLQTANAVETALENQKFIIEI